MKTPRSARTVSLPVPNTLFDALLLLIAGAALEAQTHGDVKPFDAKRRTLRALAARVAH
jgi:hypothetical protein